MKVDVGNGGCSRCVRFSFSMRAIYRSVGVSDMFVYVHVWEFVCFCNCTFSTKRKFQILRQKGADYPKVGFVNVT